MTDPVERIIADALDASGISWVGEHDERARGLDFYLVDLGLHIEVKQYHTDRIAEQMGRADNVIAVQGTASAMVLADWIRAASSPLR